MSDVIKISGYFATQLTDDRYGVYYFSPDEAPHAANVMFEGHNAKAMAEEYAEFKNKQ